MKEDIWLHSIWHPYTQHGLGAIPLEVHGASGSYLKLKNGQLILDGISSWWVNLLGHCHPKIVQAIQEQAKTLDHVLFAGCTHPPALELARLLISDVRSKGCELSRVFFSDNGSTAVEVALKMAFQFQHLRGNSNRNRFLAIRNSYHGDTLGAMAVGEPEGFHSVFRSLMPPVDHIDLQDLEGARALLSDRGHQYCALIIEPLVQGAGGMKFYSPELLDSVVQLCREYEILIIFDEVFSGFYRTGTAFAFEQGPSRPDFLCLSKGITGGFLPLAVTLATEEIFNAFKSEKVSQAFLHGHSYTANPIACAAAVASWKELHTPEVQRQIQTLCQATQAGVESLSQHPGVDATRHLGTLGAVELKGVPGYFSSVAPRIRKKAIEEGVLLRPLGNVLYSSPPYCTTPAEVERIYEVIRICVEEVV